MLLYSLPESITDDLRRYEELLNAFLNGEISAEKFKSFRVPFGIYEQRVPGTYMVRIRLTGGIITPKQLYTIADLSEKYGSKYLHVTTRQDLQIHDVKISDTVIILKELLDCGLSSKGGGGNTVRNIVMSVDSGINPLEPFDITPVVVALTNDLLKEEDSFNLPRKFKISFSNTFEDTAFATISDVGFIARSVDGKKGFKVYVAGGLGRKSRVADILYDFISINEVYRVVNGIKSVFYKYGNRKNRHSSRLRFLYDKIGKDKFLELFEQEKENYEINDYEKLYSQKNCYYNKEISLQPEPPIDSGFDEWLKNYVREQKQKEFYTIEIPLKNGDISTDDAKRLSKFLENFGLDVIRLSINQNIHLRNIEKRFLPNVYNLIKSINTNSDLPRVISNIVACKGADTCQLGICKPKGAVSKIYELINKEKEIFDSIGNIQINLSGCPNSCGKHLVGNLGFYGKAKKKNGYLYPAYNVLVGGYVKDGDTRFGTKIGEISAKKLPDFIFEVLKDFANSKLPNFRDYINKYGENHIRDILRNFEYVPDYDEDSSFYYDWDSKELFNVKGVGKGECSASLFDLVDLYLNQIEKYERKLKEVNEDKKAVILNELISYSVKMLNLIAGYDTNSKEELVKLFNDNYIKTGLINKKYERLLTLFLNEQISKKDEENVLDFARTVRKFYDELDENLNIQEKIQKKSNIEENNKITLKDYRGVPCPLNFVRIKVDLAGLKSGDLLEVYLDDGDPIKNVPKSLALEGHKVISQKEIDGFWSIVIRKK
ncbi:sulfurtransferase TusA family protein [Deferribacter thermophilus]|uniref:sulfurtransferase TusA family protein n=1 Tax=Deferribacter thermophilus TaxID=53573 RepID=UPI003C193733